VLISTVSAVLDVPIPLSFRITKRLARIPAVAGLLRRQIERDPARAAARSIPDATLRRRTMQDAHAWPLLQALVRSTADRMPARLPGTDRDIAVTRRRTYPLEALAVPVLAVQGTDDHTAPFTHAEHLCARVAHAELLPLQGGDHVAIFTHRNEVRPRVARFLQATATRPLTKT
jgi:pimeloyl-ACP methyl ester carboxylesterase